MPEHWTGGGVVLVQATRCGCLLCEAARRRQQEVNDLYAYEARIRERIAGLMETAMPVEQRVSLSRELESEKSRAWDRIRRAKILAKEAVKKAVH